MTSKIVPVIMAGGKGTGVGLELRLSKAKVSAFYRMHAK